MIRLQETWTDRNNETHYGAQHVKIEEVFDGLYRLESKGGRRTITKGLDPEQVEEYVNRYKNRGFVEVEEFVG